MPNPIHLGRNASYWRVRLACKYISACSSYIELMRLLLPRDLKAVTIWFQNKRQTTKRPQRSAKENVIPEYKPIPMRKSKSFPLVASRPARRTVSLDHFADRYQQPGFSPSANAPPLTPRGTNVHAPPSAKVNKSDIWKHMLSSPIAPVSPTADVSRFSLLPPRSKSMRSLEWACAKDRAATKRHEELVPFRISRPNRRGRVTDHVENKDTDARETIPSRTSADILPPIALVAGSYRGPAGINAHPSEEVEAAMGLLGLMSRR